MMTNTTSQIKVVKNEGDFKRAMEAGFAINLFECSDAEMWLVLPMEKADMKMYAEHHGFTPVAVTQ